MTFYRSTRSEKQTVSGARAVLNGLSPDGGLYVPEALPDFDTEGCLKDDFLGQMTRVLSAFLPDIPDMDGLVRRAYGGKFDDESFTPSLSVGDMTMLELWHGPTCAFKDVALTVLPHLMTAARAKEGETGEILILTATSGDTGKAALCGFQDVPGIGICVFYPDGGVSPVQRTQMVTQEGRNVCVCAVKGNFDDAQTGVKMIFEGCGTDPLPGTSVCLSSANSINIGRLAPQIAYYFRAYADMASRGDIAMGEEVNFAVPTGNFGDILAGYLAKRLGLPVGRLICASNENNVLADFLSTGVYDRRRTLHKTVSPSMDILVSSNLERLLFMLEGDDKGMTAGLMEKLKAEGVYSVPAQVLEQLQAEFSQGFCDDEETKRTIGEVYGKYGYLMDTHTAVAWSVAQRYRSESGDKRRTVVLSTASPFKFPEAVLSAIGEGCDGDEFEMMERLSEVSGLAIPKGLSGLKNLACRHSDVIDKDKMLEFVMEKGVKVCE